MSKKKSKNKLTTQQRTFVEKFVSNGFNGKRACIAAGYSERSAESTASRLLRNDKVQVYLKECRQRLLNDTEKQAVDWLSKVETLSCANIKKVADWDPEQGLVVKPSIDIDDADAYGISEIQSKWNKDSQQYDFKVKMVDKSRYLDMKGKFIGTLSDGFDVTNRNNEEGEKHSMSVQEKNNRLLELLAKVKDES